MYQKKEIQNIIFMGIHEFIENRLK